PSPYLSPLSLHDALPISRLPHRACRYGSSRQPCRACARYERQRSQRDQVASSGTCAAARLPRAAAGSPASRTRSSATTCLRRGGSRSDSSSVPLSPFPLGNHDLHVAGSLLDRSRTSHRGRHEALELRALVHDGVLHV